MSHTKGKWYVEQESDGQLWIASNAPECLIAQICHGILPSKQIEITQEERANAEIICRSVNSHDELVEALTWAKQIGKNGATHDKMAFEKIETALKNAQQ